MKFAKNIALINLLFIMVVLAGCDKTKPYKTDVPAPRAHFVGKETQVYSVVDNPAPAFVLQVGTTDVASSDRLVTYHVSSVSGAIIGTQYTITGLSGNSGTVNIVGGKALADITIQANAAEYASGRRDTLQFTISTPSLEAADFLDTVNVILAGPTGCSEANPDFVTDLGMYPNTNELLGGTPYGPYITSITSITPTAPTTATMVVQNIWDNGWGPISFTIDWTNPLATTVDVIPQNNIPGSDAGDLNAMYAGFPIAVRPYATSGPGTYSSCDQDFTLNMQLGVGDGAGGVQGFFDVLYQVHLQR